MTPPTETRPRKPPSVGAFVIGLVVAIVLNFVLNFLVFFSIYSYSGIQPGYILLSWVVTAFVGWVAFRLHPWGAYGMLGGYAALFLVLLLGGMTGPYACFAIYGYPIGR